LGKHESLSDCKLAASFNAKLTDRR
jgi:hypothetical protein